MRIEKEGKSLTEDIDIEPPFHGCFHISPAIAQGEGHFFHCCAARFTDMISRDGDGIPFGKFPTAPFEDVGDDTHRGTWRIDVGPTRGILLEDIVLDRTRQPGKIRTLSFRLRDIKCQEDMRRRVDGHGCGNLIEPNPVKQRSHIPEAVDGDANLPYLTFRHRMITVIPDLSRQVKCHT